MSTYIFRLSDGANVSWNTSDADQVAPDNVLAANGLGKLVGALPLDATHSWDPITRTVIVTAPVITPRNLATFDLINAFTPAEWAGVVASANTTVKQFLFMLQCSPQIDMNNVNISSKIQGLVALGLLTQIRADAIKAAVAT